MTFRQAEWRTAMFLLMAGIGFVLIAALNGAGQ